jgi:DNA-binding MarR family transcriptional regulator
MSSGEGGRQPTRRELIAALMQAGRANSDATVLFHTAVAERVGLNPTDHKVMSILERLGPMPAGEIARQSGLATPSVTALVDRLERRGFVQRRPDPGDRRKVIVEAAPGGVARIAPLVAGRRGAMAKLLARYSEDELAAILDFLERSTRRLRQDAAALAARDDP